MSRFNEGLVYTNNKCVGCNKCISVCPAMGANVSVSSEGKTRLEVSKKCIECGLCVSECSHRAREFRDDAETFFDALKDKNKVSLLVDPAFYMAFSEKAPYMLGFLKKLGVNKIYDVAFGADISMFAHAKYIKENLDKNHQCRQYLAGNCSAMVNFVECVHPEVIPMMIPVQSPLMCTAIYVRKYLKDNSELAVLSPCITTASEIRSSELGKYVDYSLTFTALAKIFKKEGNSDYKASADLSSSGLGNIVSAREGFSEGVSYFFGKEEIFETVMGFTEKNVNLITSSLHSEDTRHPLMVTLAACSEGCVYGNAVRRKEMDSATVAGVYRKIRSESFTLLNSVKSPDEYYEAVKNQFKDIDLEDFAREYSDRYRQPYQVPEDAINDIYDSMHKDTKVKQSINCRACGYDNCREMAIAIANGYARIQDCVQYMNDDLKYIALVDRMTGIANNAGFKKHARAILDENPDKNYIMFVGNVNKLKNVNDLYGSEMGDTILAYVAKKLEEMVEGIGVCGRFGGGVFGVMFEDKQEYVENFMKAESYDCRHLGVYFPVTIRYGVYRIGEDKSARLGDITNLCTYAADKAKNRTVNSYIEYTDSMRQEMQIETDITLKMRDAMANGEFVLYLQPQYDHQTGRIVGAEALSRWIKADGSIISPGVFIPVFEKNGFIRDMDRYVWENAFKLVEEWEKTGAPMVPISVNISRISLETDEIVAVIGKLADKYPIDKKHLYFEITESAYMNDQGKLTERIMMLKNLGFRIAMDDFGSGYSSLNSLKDIPLDVLKLDMGFLRGGTNISRGNEIIAHILEMAKALSLKIVAEGVETKEQADFLTERGCDVIQGYYYAKPMPLSEYAERLKKDI